MKEDRKIRIAVCSLFQDAGEATRALELAEGLTEQCPTGFCPEIIFLSHGGRFERMFAKAGFSVEPVRPRLPGLGFRQDLRPSSLQFVGDPSLAADLLRGEVKALTQLKPDLVLHGFWPVAGMASKLAGLPEAAYLPIPFEPGAFSTYLMRDLPDFMGPLTLLPRSVRVRMMAAVPRSVKLKVPLLRQSNLIKAYDTVGGAAERRPRNLFDMLKADFTVVNDFPDFYRENSLPDSFAVTGPLFPRGNPQEEVNPEIRRKMAPDSGELKIFCTLGSSGGKDFLLEAIHALRQMNRCSAVVLCPPAVCPLEEAKKAGGGCQSLYLTDDFVPAFQVSEMADITLCHGGQGTLQTAIAGGSPIVGFAMQPEQQINLDHVVSFGAAVRLPAIRWKAARIRSVLEAVASDPQYRINMEKLQKRLLAMDGKAEAARAIWTYWNLHCK